MKKFWRYIAVTFGLGWLLQGIGTLLGGLWFTVLVALCMFAPMLGVLAAEGSLKTARSGVRWKPRFRGRWGWWLAALWGPAAIAVLGAAVYYLVFPGRFDGGMTALTAQLEAAGSAGTLSPWVMVLLTFLEAVTFAPLVNMLFAVGEETGWRGYMTPFLCGRLGRKKGLVLSGLIWGAWHWPIICLAGYNFGTGYFGWPVTGALMMCAACAALGILLSFLYDRTESVWVPALAHGAFNAAASIGTVFLTPGVTSYILGPTPLGLVAGLPMFALALCAFSAPRREKEKTA